MGVWLIPEMSSENIFYFFQFKVFGCGAHVHVCVCVLLGLEPRDPHILNKNLAFLYFFLETASLHVTLAGLKLAM